MDKVTPERARNFVQAEEHDHPREDDIEVAHEQF